MVIIIARTFGPVQDRIPDNAREIEILGRKIK